MIKVRDDLTGDIFGNFLVLKQVDDYISPKGCHRSQWKCKCLLCNNDEVIIMDIVLKKQTKLSCGCIDDLTGKRFGRLTVISKDGKDKNNNTIWHCKCDCGNTVSVIHSRLTNENVRSCGCLRSDMAVERFSKENIYDVSGEYGIGYTTNTNKPFYFDLEDYNKIKQYTWFEDIATNGYHSLKTKDVKTGKVFRMSSLFGFKYHDHINRNPLDNRKENFREATAQENARNRTKSSNNTSGFIGVCWDKEKLKWLSYIAVDNKQIKLGRFHSKEDAIRTRLLAEKKYFKEFAPQRHLFAEYGIEENENFLENPLDKS